MNIALDDFKKYFNEGFWKAFKEKVLFYDDQELSPDNKNSIVERVYQDLNDRNYYPSIPRHTLYKEKSEWVPRIIPVFEVEDYCVYYFCLKQLEDRIAENKIPNTFGWWSLGGKMRKYEEDEISMREEIAHEIEDEMANHYDVSVSEYSFNPRAWSKAYWDFNAKLYSTIQTHDFPYCVEFDISNFYDCINLNLLEIWIRELWDPKDSDAISILFHFLQFWNRKNNCYNRSTVWLPQDALNDCSRILANFYLQKYDAYIYQECGEEYKYFRYADDQFIFWKDEEWLRRKLFQASVFLNKLWLSVNPKKVKYWEVDNLLEYRSFELFDLVSESNINPVNVGMFISMVVSVNKNAEKNKLKDKWISLLNRAINLNLEGVSMSDRAYLKWLFLDKEYLLQAKPFQLAKIYRNLENNEKMQFIQSLNLLAKSYRYNQFHYSVLQFLENLKLDKSTVLSSINELREYSS